MEGLDLYLETDDGGRRCGGEEVGGHEVDVEGEEKQEMEVEEQC